MVQLHSLADWSKDHIRAVFESPNREETLKAIQATFSTSINATLNGRQLAYHDIVEMVLRLRAEAPGGLKVQWLHAVESSTNSNHQNGCLGGVYIIRGIYRTLPGSADYVEIGRRKAIVAQIESQSGAVLVDSRRIVQLTFVASDVPL